MVRRQQTHADLSHRRKLAAYAAALGLIALVIVAALWPGYDAQDVPPEDAELWVLRSGAAEQYGCINTEVSELETVKPAANPTSVLQQGATAVLFADGNRRFTVVDPALPADLSEDEGDQWSASPPDTRRVMLGGDTLLFVTDNGALFTAAITSPDIFTPVNPDAVDPEDLEEDEQPPVFLADAATITDDGTVLAIAQEGPEQLRVVKADGTTGEVISDKTASGTTGGRSQVALVDDKWVLLDRVNGELWTEGGPQAVSLDADLAPTLRTSGTGKILIADVEGLLEVDPDGAVGRTVTVPAGSVPAQPKQIGDRVYAAWMAEGDGGGLLWDSETQQTTVLPYGGLTLPGAPDPRITTNGSRHAVTDAKSGWVWVLPTGELVRSSQAWSVDDDIVEQVITAEVQETLEPKPPVAVSDVFGVRAGSETALPVLLNDYDPNRDVLSIHAPSVTGLDPDFGTVTLANNMQQLVVNVSEEAQGSASFTYQVTDGTTEGGLLSNKATVTLNVVPEETNSAPVWCGVDECLATWPNPIAAPGQTLSVNVLEAWVDPDGDPVFLSGVGNPTHQGIAVANPNGTLTYKAEETESGGTENVPLEVTVSDTRGDSTTRIMNVRVSPEAPIELTPKVALGVVGQPLTVNLEDAITGGQGAVRLVEATPEDTEAVQIAPSSSALRFTITAEKPGSYPIRVVVGDGRSEATGTVRVILMAEEEAQVTTAPVTVFVRPSEDATVDILPTVMNPAGHVLLVDQLAYEPAAESELSADILGQRYIHASGNTATGEPGLLGRATYRVSDGTGTENTTALGEITFMLLPASDSTYPIAGDRHVTVNAGAQVDFPVLDWAVAPAGSQIAVDAATVANETEDGLAFGTQKLVRYLAPEQPGEYAVSYSVYRLGDPNLRSTGRLTIEVVEPDPEAKPRPATLEGRVLAGQQISIKPDYQAAALQGETVRLSAVTEQPTKGSAAVSADGETLVYMADPGTTGQDSFKYEVVATTGQKTTSQVKIGILDAHIVPVPVTFSDYVQMAVGSDSEVAVYPTNNDTDPLGEGLELVDVEPNAPMDSEEYAALKARIRSVDTETGEVRLAAGDEVGTSSFIYTARGARGDTATGLIITKVVRERVLDVPAVSDTVLTAETLSQLPGGIDVLDGKVQWVGGDAGTLVMSMWQQDSPYHASGARIKGPVPDKFTVVPFEVKGDTFLGEEATSFGFLKVPSEKEVHLALREAYQEIEVDEGKDVSIDLTEAVAVPKDEKLVVDAAAVSTSGARAAARCTVTGETLTYTAGEGEPWRDVCVVPVKTAEQDTFTHLSIAVRVIPKAPQPTLVNASITVSPGSVETYDLKQMVEWDGEPDWGALQFAVQPAGQLFEVTQSGSQLTVRAKDDSKPTRTESVSVSLPSHADAGGATLSLVVGPRPSLMPRGGTVTQECTQAGGNTSCNITVRDAVGQTNPFPGTPLKLVEAISPSDCSGVSFEVTNENTVRATWGSDAPGGMCKGGFVMEDAQGARTTGEGVGVILLDLQGLPAAPASVTWTAFGPDSVTLKVEGSGTSYPEVTEFTWSGDGKTGTCPTSGECHITGLSVGKKVDYTVHAVNGVGESRAAASVTAWAYKPPAAPTVVRWDPVKTTDGAGGVISLQLSAADGTKEISVARDGTQLAVAPVVNGEVTFPKLAVGNTGTTLTATPKSQYDVPVPPGGSSEGDVLTVNGVHGVGAPTVKVAQLEVRGATATVRYEVDPGSPNVTVKTKVALSVDGTSREQGPFDRTSGTIEFENIPYGAALSATVTANNFYKDTDFGVATKSSDAAQVEVPAPTNLSANFGLNTQGAPSGAEGHYSPSTVWNKGAGSVTGTCKPGTQLHFSWNGAGDYTETTAGLAPPSDGVQVWCEANGRKSPVEQLTPTYDGPFNFYLLRASGGQCPANFLNGSLQGPVYTSNLEVLSVDGPEWYQDVDEGGWRYPWYKVKFKLDGVFQFSDQTDSFEWTCEGPGTEIGGGPEEGGPEEGGPGEGGPEEGVGGG